MLICGHAFYHKCFAERNNKCNCYLEFYNDKKGGVFNIKPYKKKILKTPW